MAPSELDHTDSFAVPLTESSVSLQIIPLNILVHIKQWNFGLTL